MRKPEYDSKLIVYRSRQVFIMVAGGIMNFIFALMVLQNQRAGFPWWALIAPVIGCGALFLLVPSTEIWEYKPWQGKARRIEQQQR